eukprot:21160_1
MRESCRRNLTVRSLESDDSEGLQSSARTKSVGWENAVLLRATCLHRTPSCSSNAPRYSACTSTGSYEENRTMKKSDRFGVDELLECFCSDIGEAAQIIEMRSPLERNKRKISRFEEQMLQLLRN